MWGRRLTRALSSANTLKQRRKSQSTSKCWSAQNFWFWGRKTSWGRVGLPVLLLEGTYPVTVVIIWRRRGWDGGGRELPKGAWVSFGTPHRKVNDYQAWLTGCLADALYFFPPLTRQLERPDALRVKLPLACISLDTSPSRRLRSAVAQHTTCHKRFHVKWYLLEQMHPGGIGGIGGDWGCVQVQVRSRWNSGDREGASWTWPSLSRDNKVSAWRFARYV